VIGIGWPTVAGCIGGVAARALEAAPHLPNQMPWEASPRPTSAGKVGAYVVSVVWFATLGALAGWVVGAIPVQVAALLTGGVGADWLKRWMGK